MRRLWRVVAHLDAATQLLILGALVAANLALLALGLAVRGI